MKEFELQKIKGILKLLLKKKNITYEMLAEQMECSVPTVTRFLGTEELTLTRLLQLCEILDIDLADVQNLMASEKAPNESFTPEQETFLVKNKNILSFLMKLFSDETPKQIAEKYKLTAKATDKYLMALEKQNLIRVTGKQKVKTVFKSLPTFGDGPLGRAYFEAIVRNACNFFITKISDDLHRPPGETKRPGSKFSTATLKITPASYTAWAQEREKSYLALRKLAVFEEKSKPASELKVMVFIDAHSLVDPNYAGLQILENTFGNIPNI
jgi:transcriptional regulator with XRE-family HTH domain